MKLSPEDKSARERDRLLEKAREFSAGTYCRRFVAPLFQKMIRAEAGADPRQYVTAVVDGQIQQVERRIGQCVCITCGKVGAWDSGIRGFHTGHFAASRRNSILLEEDNVKPQCASCNYYRSGSPAEFRMFMEATAGISVIERLQALKRQSVSFSRDDLVDKRLEYSRRLKAAEAAMKGTT